MTGVQTCALPISVLEQAGLVTKHPRGREQRVRGNPDALRNVRALLDENWRRCGSHGSIRRTFSMMPAKKRPMTVTNIHKDLGVLTMTATCD